VNDRIVVGTAAGGVAASARLALRARAGAGGGGGHAIVVGTAATVSQQVLAWRREREQTPAAEEAA